MKLSLEVQPLRRPLRAPFATAHGRRTSVVGLLLRVQDGEGGFGLGEVTPVPDFGTESYAEATQAVSSVRFGPMPETLHQVRSAFSVRPGAPAARAGVEMALLDLLARRQRVPLALLLGAKSVRHVPVNALLLSDAPDELAEEARRAVAAGFRTLKLKVGALPASEDVERVGAVREAVGPLVKLRLDANGAWDEPEARLRLTELVAFGLEYVEQPVPAPDIAAMRRLRSLVRVGADEALGPDGSVEGLLGAYEGPAADLLVLKLAVLGGVLPALQLAIRGRALGVDVVVTSAIDGAVARAAAAHLALALGGAYAHGLATGSLLVEDPGAHPVVDGGLWLSDLPGLGIAPEVLGW